MRSYLALSCMVVALGWIGCGAESADSGSFGKEGAGAPNWLEGDPDEPFPTPEGAPSDVKATGTGGSGGRGQPNGGTGGSGGTPPTQPSTLCLSYDPSAHSHTLTGAAADPGNLASATRAREALEQGLPPIPGAVRLADFVNYFARTPVVDVAADGLGGVVELRPRKIAGNAIPNQFDLYVGVVAGQVTRPHVALTLLVDATLTPKALSRAQATVEGLGKGLMPGDSVVLMSADPSIQPVELGSLTDPAGELAQLATKIELGAGSLGPRLADAYAKAKAAPPGAWNRIVVIGDGEEDATLTDFSVMETTAKDSKILVSAIGVSPEASYGDTYLYRLAHAGRGRYLYIDDPSEPAKLFAERFGELFGFARENVRIRVDLPSWMHDLEPNTSAGDGSGQDKYLAPGEWARFVFHVAVCDAGAIADSVMGLELLTVTVTSSLPDGTGTNPFVLKSLPPKKFLANTLSPELEKMAAIQAFVDVLKYPHASRFEEAETLLGAMTASPAPELLSLLAKHPNLPSP